MSAFTNSALSAADVFKVALIGNSSLTAPEVLPATLEVDAAHPGAKVNPMFSGLMIEEINHSLDGGLYGELIQNRVGYSLNGTHVKPGPALAPYDT